MQGSGYLHTWRWHASSWPSKSSWHEMNDPGGGGGQDAGGDAAGDAVPGKRCYEHVESEKPGAVRDEGARPDTAGRVLRCHVGAGRWEGRYGGSSNNLVLLPVSSFSVPAALCRGPKLRTTRHMLVQRDFDASGSKGSGGQTFWSQIVLLGEIYCSRKQIVGKKENRGRESARRAGLVGWFRSSRHVIVRGGKQHCLRHLDHQQSRRSHLLEKLRSYCCSPSPSCAQRLTTSPADSRGPLLRQAAPSHPLALTNLL